MCNARFAPMVDLDSVAGTGCGFGGSGQRVICTICFEDLKPIIEDLQTIPICGHVFHELCIQQWLEYCPAGKNPTCPVCKQSCLRHDVTRLYFQSTGDSTQLVYSSHVADAQLLAEKVKRLEGKLAAMTTASENQWAQLKKMDEELSTWKVLAKREELRKEEIEKEKQCNEQLLNMKAEELSRKNIECTKLQERILALAKELAALKLATDLNLEEEDMVTLASIGHGSNTENAVEILKKSLARRNKSYKELMIQCNVLGRSESRTCKKLDKANEKIKKLKVRLTEVEKALEEKENEILKNLKTSSRSKSEEVNLSYVPPNSRCSTLEDQARQCAKESSDQRTLSSNGLDQLYRSNSAKLQKTSSPPVCDEINNTVDLTIDSCNYMGVDSLKLISDSNGNSTPVAHCENGQSYRDTITFGIGSSSMQNAVAYGYTNSSAGDASCKFGDSSNFNEGAQIVIKRKLNHKMSKAMTEKIILDDKQKEMPSFSVKKGAEAYSSPADLDALCFSGLLQHEYAERSSGKWCRQMQSSSSGGDLIAVGADGRGGRIKVLRSQEQFLGGLVTALGSKRHKHGTKQSSQFNIEHFFAKTRNDKREDSNK